VIPSGFFFALGASPPSPPPLPPSLLSQVAFDFQSLKRPALVGFIVFFLLGSSLSLAFFTISQFPHAPPPFLLYMGDPSDCALQNSQSPSQRISPLVIFSNRSQYIWNLPPQRVVRGFCENRPATPTLVLPTVLFLAFKHPSARTFF